VIIRLLSSLLVLALASGSTSLAAQEVQPAKPAGQTLGDKPLVALELQIVVSRYQNEKKISSLPFTVSVNANDRGVSSLRMGAEVPVPAMVFTPAKENAPPNPITSVNYRPIGTNIDCTATSQDDGRFNVFVSVDDSSVYKSTDDGGTPAVKEMPVFRSFKSEQRLLLRDGQSRQFTAATDRVNGEVVKIDVTLRVVK
jgi:hypothetical protein